MSCYICEIADDTQDHHIILRKECKPLENCEMNKVRVCTRCHDYIHKHPMGHIELKRLKMEFQNKLEIFFNKEYFSREEIKEILEIKDKPVDRLLKTLVKQKGLYEREDVIRACMGGKILI
ncbi:MAG: hypothetical protein Q8936_16620 [Bacillota bacterium]|nr:hypothetical protein [Bacillota bacterium]